MQETCPRCKRRIRVKKSRDIKCPCGFTFTYDSLYDRQKVYLLDSNIFIIAEKNQDYRWKHCIDVLMRHDVATVDVLIDTEISPNRFKEHPVQIYKLKKISEDIKELTTNAMDKQASEQDLAIIQVAIDNPDIAGIITYDIDFKNLATKGLIEKKSNYKLNFFVGTAEEFLKTKRAK